MRIDIVSVNQLAIVSIPDDRSSDIGMAGAEGEAGGEGGGGESCRGRN